MAKHTCPDCGASHEMNAEGRIARLEERVKELEDRPDCPHVHYYWPTTYTWPTIYPWTVTGGTSAPNLGPVTVYNNTSGFLLE